jgi:low temperature requirement protein LtrA
MAISLAIDGWWLRVLLPVVFICNYLPPFISHVLLKRAAQRLDLSGSMFERLGLFTLIIFGELVLGIINGLTDVPTLNLSAWLNFALAVSMVFGLWWIFFTMIARREARKNFARASLLELLYIPALIALGFLAAGFPTFFLLAGSAPLQHLFSYGISVFLISISLMIGLLEFPPEFDEIITRMRLSIFSTGLLFLLPGIFQIRLSTPGYLITDIILLNLNIVYLNFVYYRQLNRKGLQPSDE